jgi:hypothetical protein
MKPWSPSRGGLTCAAAVPTQEDRLGKIVKWGFKLWMMACSSSGFCSRLKVEEGLRPGEKSRRTPLRGDGRGDEGAHQGLPRGHDHLRRPVLLLAPAGHRCGQAKDAHRGYDEYYKNRIGFPKEAAFQKAPKKNSKDQPPGYVPPARGDVLSAVNEKYGLRAITWIDNQHVSMLAIASRGCVKKTVPAKRKGKDKRGKKYALDVQCPEIIYL